MLDAAARGYIAHPRGVEVTPRGLVLSSIYDWFRIDFGGSPQAVIAHILEYAAPDKAADIRRNTTIAGYRYDWSINA